MGSASLVDDPPVEKNPSIDKTKLLIMQDDGHLVLYEVDGNQRRPLRSSSGNNHSVKVHG